MIAVGHRRLETAMRLGVLATLWLVTACATNQQSCISRGHRPGTDDYADCMAHREQAGQDALDRVRSFESGNAVWKGSIHPPVCVGRTCY
ncbi:hypothetical protein [Azospirillum sp. sgz301742]